METNITNQATNVLVKLSGRLDTVSAAQCEKDLQPLWESADKEIVLDCTALEYVCSSGLRIFLSLRKAVEAKGGKLIIEHINDEIRKVFTLTGFFQLFDIRL